MTQIIDARWQARRGTASDLAIANEVPLEGEVIFETDTKLGKVGDGFTHYNDLLYSLIGSVDLTDLGDGKILIRKEDSDGARWVAATPESVVLPPGGNTGQVLTKVSTADGDVDWEDTGGSTGTFGVTWNPLDCAAAMILTNNSSVASYANQSATAALSVRATRSFTTGKRYFEVHITEQGASYFGHIGVMDASASLAASVGAATNGWSYYQQTGNKIHAGTSTSYGGAIYTTGDRIGCAFDLNAGKIWWARNGAWIASGDPASGANPAFTGLSGTLFPAISVYGGNGPTFRGIFKAAQFNYAPPTGFSAVDS